MGKFKHHSDFQDKNNNSTFLFPHVCFVCCKSFKKPESKGPSTCPECEGDLVRLSRKFTTPKSSNKAQWQKIKYLVDHGFLFQTIYELVEDHVGVYRAVNYPKSLKEAKEFVENYNSNSFPNAF